MTDLVPFPRARIGLLRWTLAVVLGAQAAVVTVVSLRPGGPGPVHSVIAAAELVGCGLLLAGATRRAGGLVLLAVLAAAAVVTIAEGRPPPPSFAVYAVTLLVVSRGADDARAP
jgi:hypothetical protein